LVTTRSPHRHRIARGILLFCRGRAGAKLINSVKLFSDLANIDDAKSLIIPPSTTTHSPLSPEEQEQTCLSPESVRRSIGIEDACDIIADPDRALRASRV
jgi:O-acetylhomoserine (thiol)-lyase